MCSSHYIVIAVLTEAHANSIVNKGRMMEKTYSNLDKIQQAYQAFASGNIQALIESISDDIIWNNHLNPQSPFYGNHKGIESFQKYFSMLANNDINEIKVHSAIEGRNKSIVIIDVKGTDNYVHVVRLAMDKVTRVDIYNKNVVV